MTETSRKDDSLRRRLVELTRDLIIIPSTRDRPEDIQRCMEFVINHVELPNELTVRRFNEEGSPSTVILPHNISAPEVLLLAHLDVVARGEGAEYRSLVEDGKIYGPGSGDMKGELAILLETAGIMARAFFSKKPGSGAALPSFRTRALSTKSRSRKRASFT
jgi:succinyl-diaminopimelate desuccinylase